MRTLRIATAVATILMSLLNLPFAFDDGGQRLPAALAWLITLLGVAGLVAAVALLRRAAWATPAVIAVGLLNLAGGIVALVQGQEGAVIGTTLSLIITVLALAYARIARPAHVH
jgi:hypothetical protein